ncbi:MAG: restriction endonuclease subunit S [Bacteroidales bacterium]|nr:restriction endonuclease subunit S [Bacteroidales bacterium]
MSEWKEYKLGDLIETNKKSIGKNYPYSRILYLDTGSITCNNIESYQEFELDKSPSRAKRLVKQDDIIYSSVRPNQLHYGYITNPQDNLVVSTGFITITCNKEVIYPKFLFYYLIQDYITEYLHSVAEASTSAYPSLKADDIESLYIELPPLSEQKSIASILSSLDDKIDLLHRENKTLEAMAETLFRQWFIEEAKEDDMCLLGEVIKTTSGGTPSRKNEEYYCNGNIEWVKSKELHHSYILDTEEKITEDAITNSSAKLLPENSVLIAMYGATVGEYGIISKPMTCNQAICALIPNENYPYTYLYLWVKYMQGEFINLACGAAQQNISQELIKQQYVSNDLKQISDFHILVAPYLEKMKVNQEMIQTLIQTRDSLLPKLMSGEIKV